METNHQHITSSLSFLQSCINSRLADYFKQEHATAFSYPEWQPDGNDSAFSDFLSLYQPNNEERIILMLALMPHVQPNFLDAIIQQYLPDGGDFQEIGGVKGTNHRGTLPTGETALFVLAGNDISKRLQATSYFSGEHFFAKNHILSLEQVKEGEPRMSGRILLEPEYIDLFTTGTVSPPAFSPDFPARPVTTAMEWSDLVINTKTANQINDIKVWLLHNGTFMRDWQMDKRIKPGFRTLFYGPSGTGKTLTATLLGKEFKKSVYRIDLSQIVSKYIGETEKNLEKVFNKAENKDWILFFDEADALFGKRSNVQSAHDKYANQEVSYLLQRVEDFPGLIILASNYKSNIDQAFVRRFNSIIHFPMPNAEERYALWQTALPVKAPLEPGADLQNIALRYDLSGAAITNVIQYASLQTIYRNSPTISVNDILEGIRREYEKEERVFVK
ncbi:ATP-binding protein [Chitinophaga sp. MM2321]|uniref:ATP-binding protein n=1 Tax=Chitinophaga sp. MM2321 TaxID=3137178 RepID=UPI0032D57275